MRLGRKGIGKGGGALEQQSNGTSRFTVAHTRFDLVLSFQNLVGTPIPERLAGVFLQVLFCKPPDQRRDLCRDLCLQHRVGIGNKLVEEEEEDTAAHLTHLVDIVRRKISCNQDL